jgi:aspartate racemase
VKTLGIVAHSAEGASLCFATACLHGDSELGAYMHPDIVMSAVPMGLSMPGWESGDYSDVAKHLAKGVQIVADGGADFYVCPDNTAHIVLESIAENLPIPGLHIARVVCDKIRSMGFQKIGLLGTKWTMGGPVYIDAMNAASLTRIVPREETKMRINGAIFSELCRGIVTAETTQMFQDAVQELKDDGAECVVLGCTEIPIVVTEENSPLPPIDSTRLLARRAVNICIETEKLQHENGWVV